VSTGEVEHLEHQKQRRLSALAIVAGAAILLFLGLQSGYGEFYRWLAHRDLYLVSEQAAVFGIPSITPTLIPAPTPTPEPEPTPIFEPEPLPAIRIIIPKIEVNERIVEIGLRKIGEGEAARYLWDTAEYAVGHRENSAHPGQQDNIILSGHNNAYGEVFRRLDELEPGDLIYLYTLDQEFVYVVEKKDLVLAVGATEEDDAKHARYTARSPDETLTLASCWPYVTYTHRIYVIAKPQK